MSESKVYIAAVLVTCYVAGERRDIPPGEPLPELSEHDTAQLLRMKAIRDPQAEAVAAKAQDKVRSAAQEDFALARQAVHAEVASLTTGAAPPEPTEPAAAAAAKKAAKAAKA